MAYQHLYTRVPSRQSMFEHTDGFDTFIKSLELDQKTINDNLYPFCVIKLTQNEANAIRGGLYPITYAQYISKKGKFIQSALTYLPLDFTGERSSYLVHSLVFTEEERINQIKASRNNLFNSSLFITNVEQFDLNNKDNKPLEDYQEKVITFTRAKNPQFIVDSYQEQIIKHFIFALIQSTLPKGKNVYCTFTLDNIDISQKALELLNTISLVLPPVVKNRLSFITFLPEKERYNNLIKIKFIPRENFIPSPGKGYFFDFTSETPSFIKDSDYKPYEHEIDFLYDLLTNNQMRMSFLTFYDNICELNPKEYNFELKDLRNVILLYKTSNPVFNKYEIVPFEKELYDLLLIYESYKEYITIKDRLEILSTLQRYPEKRQMIPLTTFQKITKLYQTEPEKCKKKIMAIMLDLIHTDVMRDKLFTFIKQNYNKEDRTDRDIISEDLSRVFYGGFLQTQILNLFNTYFDTESLKSRENILDKVLLSIRTQTIQERIFVFLDSLYEKFNNHEKEMIYHTFYEMIPYCDNLSKTIIQFIDSHIENENKEFKNVVFDNIFELVSNDEHKKDKILAKMILDNQSILSNELIKLIFTSWSGRNIYQRYVESVRRLGLERLSDTIILIISLSTNFSLQVLNDFLFNLIDLINNKETDDIFKYLSFDIKLRNSILSKSFQKNNHLSSKEKQQQTEDFYNNLYENAIKNRLSICLSKSIDLINNLDDLDKILDYKKINPDIVNDKGFILLEDLREIISYSDSNDLELLINKINSLSLDNEILKQINDLFIRLYENQLKAKYENENDNASLCVEYLLLAFNQEIKVYESLFNNIRSHIISYNTYAYKAFRATKESKKYTIELFANVFAFKQLLTICNYIDINDEITNQIIETVFKNNDKNYYKTLEDVIYNFNFTNEQTISLKNKILTYVKENKKGFFSRLFNK